MAAVTWAVLRTAVTIGGRYTTNIRAAPSTSIVGGAIPASALTAEGPGLHVSAGEGTWVIPWPNVLIYELAPESRPQSAKR